MHHEVQKSSLCARRVVIIVLLGGAGSKESHTKQTFQLSRNPKYKQKNDI